MTVRINLRTEGLLKGGNLAAWTTEAQRRIRAGVAAGMTAGGQRLRTRLRQQMASAFKLRRRQFVSVMTYKVYASKPNRLPAMEVGALRAPWLESHETGATIRGPLLIPLSGDKRIGGRRFRQIVDGLMRQGNAFFQQAGGKTLLFAENIPESRALVGSFARRFARAARGRGGGGRVKAVPIAVLVKQVTLRKRLKVQETVRQGLPDLARDIERSMRL